MNERIKQLAEQATTEEHDGFRYFDKAKFAELIVRESKDILLDMINSGQGDFDTLDLALTEINEHFGIQDV